MGMDEKVDEVLKQYKLDIKARKRVRGSVVIESEDKFYVVKPYRMKREFYLRRVLKRKCLKMDMNLLILL